ncbi:hypothetical protein EON63_08625 [archaeon]|nr:MAG: hypothetical protein EON63_08625 [archaeon]
MGRLVDLGYPVTWIDPSFSIGRMGQYYREVPANTLNSDFLVALMMCKSFQFEQHQARRRLTGQPVMAQWDGDQCYPLGAFVECLEDCTKELLPLTKAMFGTVTSMSKTSGSGWKIEVAPSSNQHVHRHAYSTSASQVVTCEADVVILMCGSKPVCLPGLPQLNDTDGKRTIQHTTTDTPTHTTTFTTFHPLDQLVCPKYVNTLIHTNPTLRTQTWGVIGSSHSGMLVVKNLVESGVSRVVSYYRSPMKFMHITPTGCKKYQGIGLKGPVGDWVKAQLQLQQPAFKLIQVKTTTDWSQQLVRDGVQHGVMAVGYKRDVQFPVYVDGLAVARGEYDGYDKMTGEICVQDKKIGLFGGGIAFPQDLVDDEGEVEPWVGFKRSIEQTDLMIKVHEGY